MTTLLCKSVYGGRIDNEIDQRLLEAFVTKIFTGESFQSTFSFVDEDEESGTPCIHPPVLNSYHDLLDWVDALPNTQIPTWIGLPVNAETVLLTNRAKVLVANTLKLQVHIPYSMTGVTFMHMALGIEL
eukprot:m.94056 g.94056  ORF g.94056 m.94056 type:complete len:129 (+) comp12403_c0_seq1:3465-3851(+)